MAQSRRQAHPQMRRSPPQDETEKDWKMIAGDDGDIGDEVNSVVATGFCSQDEVEVMRAQKFLLGQVRYLESRLVEALGGDIDMKKVKHDLLQTINFIAQSSKSRGGNAVLADKSQFVHQQEDMYQRREDNTSEKSSLQKVRERLAQGAQKQGGEPKPVLPPMEDSSPDW